MSYPCAHLLAAILGVPKGMEQQKSFVFSCRLVGLKNLGNSCYMNSVMQLLLTLPQVRDRYVTPAGLIFSSAPTDVASDFPTQVLGHVKSSAWRVPGQPVISHIVALWGRTACNLELQEQGVGSFLALGCMGWHQSNFILVAKTFACI